MLLGIVFVPLCLAPLVALLPAQLRRFSWIVALIPLLLFAACLAQAASVVAAGRLHEHYAWLPTLGLNLDFALDGLSLLFALLISGIGALVVLYAAGYFRAERRAFQFQGLLLLFMGAMLGLVLADNMLLLFVFWELTSLASFLLVGFMYRAPAARSAARMALIVTSLGGLALLAGLLLLGQVVGSYEISVALGAAARIQANPLYPLLLALIVLGACTKSAQVPFHFWLPGAMAAPTPASVYLHSATMVKAGIYLLARLAPALGGNTAWQASLLGIGLGTLLLGSCAALLQSDIKALLAYSTLAQLGAMTALIGLGAEGAQALVIGILGHALYKAALFMVSGNVQHATHSRNLGELGGLGRVLPLTCAAAVLAGLSMAGLPPLLGFLAKEQLIEALLEAQAHTALPGLLALALGVVALAALLTVAVSLRFVWDALLRPRPQPYGQVLHEATPLMLAGPLLLAALSLLLVFLPGMGALLGRAAEAAGGAAEPLELSQLLWHGLSPSVLISSAAIGLGLLLFALREPAIAAMRRLQTRYTGAWLFEHLLDDLLDLAQLVARPLETLQLRQSVMLVFVALIALGGGGMWFWTGVPLPQLSWRLGQLYELVVVLLIPLSALATVLATSRLKAIAALGIVGAMVSLIFALFSAPDLALTQLLVETLSLVFILIAFARLPRSLAERASNAVRLRDLVLATLVGLTTAGLALVALGPGGFESIYPYYVANSAALANGDNVVNVILVDFRGYDTLGEITVLLTAAIGAYAVLRGGHSAQPRSHPQELDGLFSDGNLADQELIERTITTPMVASGANRDE